MNSIKDAVVNALCSDFNAYGAFILFFVVLFIVLLSRAQQRHGLNWVDMITRDGTKVSTTKVLQLIGGFIASWVMVKETLQGTLTWDMFAIYLSYVASIDGFSKLIMAKYGVASSDDSSTPFPKAATKTVAPQQVPPTLPVASTKTPDLDN
jgi:hypothetical protein